MALEQSDQNRSALNWLVTQVIFLAAILIGVLTMLAADAHEYWIYGAFGVGLVFAVFILPAWGIWGLTDDDHDE